jgi:homeobox protein cut-like
MKVILTLIWRPYRLPDPQYVEFSGFDAEDGENDGLQLPDPNARKANQQQAKSLEALLSVKNKKLLEELTRFRVSSTHI